MGNLNYQELASRTNGIALEIADAGSDPTEGSDYAAAMAMKSHYQSSLVITRNAVIRELGSTMRTPPHVQGANVVDAMEALLHAQGWDKAQAGKMAGRLAGLVTTEAAEASPQAILLSRTPDIRQNYLGVVGSGKSSSQGVVRLESGRLSDKREYGTRFCDLVLPFGGVSFFEWADKPGLMLGRRDDWDFRSPSVPVEGLAIFDDPEEAAAHRGPRRHKAYVLVGSTAVFNVLEDQASQGSLAAKVLMEAEIDGKRQPAIDKINMPQAIGAGLKAVVSSSYEPVPAEAHASILKQASTRDLIQATQAAIEGLDISELAKSDWLTHMPLSRKLGTALDVAATEILRQHLNRAGSPSNGLGVMTSGEVAAMAADLKKKFVASLGEHLDHNHGYKHAFPPLGRRMQRRQVERVQKARQAD